MTKIYIDFDGVILDTWSVIIEEYYNKYGNLNLTDEKIKQIMLDIGWNNIILRSKEINNSINNITKISKKYDVCILSKINSEEEMLEKRKFLLENNIKKMEFVWYEDTKSKYVSSNRDILIDDTIKNLDEWELAGGMGIFFDKDLNNSDGYGTINNKYIILNDLLKICDIMKLRMED